MLVAVIALALVEPLSALRIAVTGATGYLGAEVVCQAVAQGHQVRAVLRSSEQPPFLPAECELLQLDDLLDPASAREAADGMDVVIHTASVFRKCDDMELELVRPNIELAEQAPKHKETDCPTLSLLSRCPNTKRLTAQY